LSQPNKCITQHRYELAAQTANLADLATVRRKNLVALIASLARSAAKAVVRAAKNFNQALSFLMTKGETVTTKEDPKNVFSDMNQKQYAIWMCNLISKDKKCIPSKIPAKLMSAVASLLKCSTFS
jgi:hypothetical protein